MTIELFVKTEEHQRILQKLETVKAVVMANSQKNDEESRFPHENIEKLKEIGYPKLTLPKQYGGDGFTIYDAVLAQERLASFDGSTALILAWSLLFIGDVFENKSYNVETMELIAKEAKNGALFNKAISEFSMGSPIRGGKPSTNAVKSGNNWIINGRKNYTTGAYALDYFITFAWIDELDTAGYFLVPKTAVGVSIEENWDVVAMRSTGSHDLVLKDVELPENVLLEVQQKNAGIQLNCWSLLIPATYLGIAQAARDYAFDFATKHSPNSIAGTIAELPNVQAQLGKIELALMKARFALYGAAEACTDAVRKQYAAHTLNVAKHVVTNEALEIVDTAMRIVGAKSLQRNCPLQRYYRDVRAGLHNPPMDDITIAALAKSAIEQTKSKLEN